MSILPALLGVSIPLVVVFGKFVIEPLARSFGRGSGESAERMALLERRMAVMEQSIETMERSMTRLLEEAEFQRQLAAPRPPGDPAPPPAGDAPPAA
jgi:hypothetical protein